MSRIIAQAFLICEGVPWAVSRWPVGAEGG